MPQDEAAGPFPWDVVIIGGCGRVGLPLGIAFAARGLTVQPLRHQRPRRRCGELRPPAVRRRRCRGAACRCCPGRPPRATTDPASVAGAEHVVVIVGTPVDEHLNPNLAAVPLAIDRCVEHLREGQLIILRSTVHPGVTALTEKLLAKRGVAVDVAFCPERIAEGRAMTELFDLPQIVSGRNERALDRAEKLFRVLTDEIVVTDPGGGGARQAVHKHVAVHQVRGGQPVLDDGQRSGLDFDRIRHAITHDYPRAADMPGAGFAAGPCLFKDTMQLAAFNKNNFVLGHSAMLINEGLPLYLVSKLEARYDLSDLTVGLLGMAFKGGSDDPRESLAYKLRKILMMKAGDVLCHDPVHLRRPVPAAAGGLERADLLVIVVAAPGVPGPGHR